MKLNRKKINEIEKPSIRMLLQAADKIGVDVELVDKNNLIYRLEKNGKIEYIKSKNTLLPFNTTVSNKISANKQLSKKLLALAGIKTPAGHLLESKEELKKYLDNGKLTYPLVIKPNALMCGLGVFANLGKWEDAELACRNIERSPEIKNKSFIAEEFFRARDFRVLTLDDNVLATMERVIPKIVGNGQDTIEKLISDFRKGEDRLVMDDEITRNIDNAGYKKTDILDAGQELVLRYNANVATGGIGMNVTDQVSEYFKEIAVKSLAALGLRYGGVDIMTNDISDSDADYRVIEVNGSPDMAMHNFPHKGSPLDVAPVIIEKLFS